MNKFYLLITCLIIFGICGLSGCKSSDVTVPFAKNEKTKSIVSTQNGKVRGVLNESGEIELFAGIPFAKPPVGNLRWKEPQDVENWNGILEADHFAPVAMQHQNSKFVKKLFNAYIHSKGDRTDFAPMSEDCLYLNIWRPAGISEDEKLPVFVYIHGGSLMSGSSWFEQYDGSTLAGKNMVFVSVAYRVGVFGYFASEELAAESPNHTTGNYGLLDQIKALEWINKNIEAFGGDVNNITIAGESAGSSSVNALCVSPLSEGLFRRAIGESSSLAVPVPSHTFRSRVDAITMGEKIMKEFNASSIKEMREIPAEKLLKTRHANNSMTVDSYAITEYPWETYMKNQNHEEALLNGFNMDEGKAFTYLSKINRKNYRQLVSESPYVTDVDAICNLRPVKSDRDAKQLYTDLFSAVCFNYPHSSWTKTVANQGRPVYEYCFTKTNKGISTMHSGEMVYCYGNLGTNKIFNQEDHKLSEIMTEYWANFAKYGDPNGNPSDPDYGKKLPLWTKAYTEENPEGYVMDLGVNPKMIEDPFINFYQYLNFDIDKQKRPVTYGKTEE